MPLTPFQKGVARILATNRNPESHVAGGAVINRGETGLRFSDDIDIFHDIAASVASSAKADEKSLQLAGYLVKWNRRTEGFFSAEVRCGEDRVRLDWTSDSAFRFFPVQADEDFGYCLHRADLATNKVLALAGRSEVRDFLDILQLDQDYLSTGAIIWAACGKDQGFTPDLLLGQANRHTRYNAGDLENESLARPVDLKALKRQWLAAKERAETLFALLPEEELGCLYLDWENRPVTPDPNCPDFSALTRHFGSVRGAWPQIS
ncbi:hypothetical protein [Singulisphaera acidiphila]|uniref:Uncharacterized protein involved in ubiquinone biosynthesis n=1 Tax=Singulisphaera acidiphila (strain ATCC BAA-1392 / DSM 18658 / VKM B-2454 / MOB10) TaxID=886293 RepID=L0DH77_SINAD|nr:hypothetical protein [Singulisphaera acidiphila]AGA28612.1 uncharacterized protein involved in ubiquinone biosynthesis [Singulisphaera acidiphila DSM 18658]